MKRRSRRKRTESTVASLVGYTRVSTEEQAREGVSLDAQAERIRAYCVAHGFTLAGLESDAGISGKVAPDGRPGLARALERIRDGEADGLVVLKLDRLSRSTRDVLDLVDETRDDGWRLISVSEHLDTGSAAGRLVVTVLAALSEMEREQIGERTTFALDAIAREGRARSRFTPYGWRTENGGTTVKAGDRSEFVPHPAEQTVLRRILRLRRQGNGARRIASALNVQGPNPRSGNPWTPSGVASILRRLERWQRAGIELLAPSVRGSRSQKLV